MEKIIIKELKKLKDENNNYYIKGGWLDDVKDEIFDVKNGNNLSINECIERCTSPKGENDEKLKAIFRAFSLFPIKETRILIIGQDPYPDDDEYRVKHYGCRAHGLAFSFQNGKEPADDSLLNIFKALDKYKNDNTKKISDIYTWNTNLEKWAIENKVLLLNTALTYKQEDNHFKEWELFITKTICNLIKAKKEEKDGKLAVFLWGKHAQNVFFQSLNKLNEQRSYDKVIENVKSKIEQVELNKKIKTKKIIKKLSKTIREEQEKNFKNIALYLTNHPSPIIENKKDGKFIKFSQNHFKACDEFLGKNEKEKYTWLDFPENNQ